MSKNASGINDTLQVIEDTQYPLIAVPFYDAIVMIRIRRLTETQISACGSISLIETMRDKIRLKQMQKSFKMQAQYLDTMNEIAKESLYRPSYDDIMKIFAHDKRKYDCRKRLKELEQLIILEKSPKKKNDLQNELYRTFIMSIVLPDNFLAAICSYALGIDQSDINKITEDMLFEAAILAINGHDNPHDHISGRFTPFNEKDIDRRSWEIYNLRKKKNAS